MSNKHYIVRTRDAGVFMAVIVSRNGDEAVLNDARRIWYWEGAASLSELATLGPSKPESCKFPAAVPTMTILGVIEIIPVSHQAKKLIDSVPVWTSHE